jgi:K+/H+ antiporter YhaU regulatory subunit KhtT
MVSEQSLLIGKKISDSGLRERYNLLVLGSKHRGQPIVFNPSPEQAIEAGMVLIVMGEVDHIARARKAC